MCSIFTGAKKCGGAKHHKGAQSRLVFCVARAAEGGDAVTVLLSAVNSCHVSRPHGRGRAVFFIFIVYPFLFLQQIQY
jgi:hypothetical protein